MSQTRRRGLKVQFIWLFLSRGTAVAIQAVLLILVGRAAGPADFGAIGTITAVCTLVAALSDFGIATYLSKHHAVGHSGEAKTALVLNILTTWATGVVLSGVLLAVYWSWAYAWAVLPIAIAFAFEKNTDTALNVPIADARNTVPLASLMIRRCLAILAYALFVYVLRVDAVWAYSFAILIGAIAGQVHIRVTVTGKYRRLQAERVPFRAVLTESFPYLVTNLSAQARALDVVIASAFLGNVAAGLYSAATRITRPLMLIPQTMATIILPHATRRGGRDARSVAWRLAGLAAASLIVVIPLSIFSGPIVNLIMGSAYDGASLAFAVSLLSLPFVALPPPLGALLQSQGQAAFVSINGVVFAVVAVCAMGCGAAFFGIAGIAAAIGLTYAAKALSLMLRIRSLPDSVPVAHDLVAEK